MQCKLNCIIANLDKTQQGFSGDPRIYSACHIFLRLIWLTLLLPCSVTYTCHRFPYEMHCCQTTLADVKQQKILLFSKQPIHRYLIEGGPFEASISFIFCNVVKKKIGAFIV